ncbi:MAG: PfkB family carbohydrate kinase [Sphaerochaeta sp.]
MKTLVVCLNPTFQRTMIFDQFDEGEVNRAKKVYFDASGKGVNCCRVLSQIGHSNILLTHVGDKNHEEMIELCNKDFVKLAYCLAPGKSRTCTTVISSNSVSELVEEAHDVNSEVQRNIEILFEKNIESVDSLIITGTKPKGYSGYLYPSFVFKAKELNKFVLLDLKGADLINSLKYRPDVIKPNLSEFVKTFFHKDILENEESDYLKEEVITKMKSIFEEFGVISVITRSTNNIWAYGDEGFFEIEIHKAEKFVNPIGCGDTFAATLTSSLTGGKKLKEAICDAALNSSINVTTIKPGSLL